MPNKSGEVEIFDDGQKSFSQLKADGKEQNIKTVLEELVFEVFSFFDKTPPEIIHRVIYDMIMNEFSNMKPSDIKLCFQRGMDAKYGKVDYFHAGTATDWIRQYADGRFTVAEDLNIVKASEYKKETWDFSKMPENIRKSFLELGKQIQNRPVRKRYLTLEQYFTDEYSREIRAVPVSTYVANKHKELLDQWEKDYDEYASNGQPVQNFKHYCDYKAKQLLIKFNEL